MSGAGPGPLLLGAAAGGIAAVALRELVLASPALVRSLRIALEPLRRASAEGYAPSDAERWRIGLIGAGALLAGALVLVGPGPIALIAAAGPAAAGWVIADRRARYRRAVERGLPEIANTLADAVAAGGSARGALIAATRGLSGPPGAELRRVATELELGVPTATTLAGLRARVPSPRVDSLAAALASRQLGGADLAVLLRRFAKAAAERDRVAADARSATAQARFTGLLVVAMPVGACLFAELTRPGFIAAILGEPATATMLALAAALQLAGFLVIRRLGRIDPA